MNEQPFRRSIRQELIVCAGILFLATVIMLPVFIRGFPAGFDAVRHYRWTTQFIEAIGDGALYPRWLPGANEGQGSPAILYYAPLSFYAAAGFSLISGETLRAMALSCWLALALSGFTMYALSRSVLPRTLGFVTAALYMMMPYHLLDLYQGSTVSEFWSFVWVPLLFDAVRRVSEVRSLLAMAYLALSYALLVLTHVPVLFLTSISLAVFALALTRNPRALLRITASLALGAGVGGIFLIPILFESRYIRLFFKFDYRDYFLFEHLRAALTTTRFPSNASPFTYLLDNDVVAFGLLAAFLVSSLLIAMGRRYNKPDDRSARLCFAIWVVTAFSILMTTRLTWPIWRITPGLSFLFFPYRWLVVASAGTTLLFGLSARVIMHTAGGLRVLKIAAAVIVVVLNLAIGALAVWRAPIASDGLAGGLSRRDTREYRPVWWDGNLRSELWKTAWLIESGDAEVRAIDDTGIEQSYSVNAATHSVIMFRTLYFPGWVSRVDGKQTEVVSSEDGHIQLNLEPGDHSLTLSFEDTKPRTAGKVASGISLLILFGLMYRALRTSRTAR
ncbi:MAG: 6-pyruvoyl-tetrahydropterin synthase-related protein [Blastocatellia bacterium]